MKKLIGHLFVAALAILPAIETRSNMAPTRFDTTERVARAISEAIADGQHFTVVNFRDKSWKEENQVMADLKALGYKVEYIRDKNVYGFNPINGALKINW